LVLLPLQHYRQHGSIKRGVQRGLASFLRNVTLESMAAAARLAQGAQTILESVDDVLTYRPTPLPSHAHSQFAQQRARNAPRGGRGGAAAAAADAQESSRARKTYLGKRANPPGSAAEGLRQAYESLSRGLQSAASQMIVVPRDEYQRSGSRGAVRSAFQAMPGAMLSPVIGGMEAVAKVLNGAASSIAPNRVQEHRDRYKPHMK
jgi:autophagy-related protein 2